MDKILIARVRHLRSAMDMNSISLEKREAISINVVACLIAERIELPSGRLERNPKIHFVEMHQGLVNEMIQEINEQVVINVDGVQRRVYDIWKERYELVHYPMKGVRTALKAIMPEDNGEMDFIADVMGVI